jgi:hypothetical protein
MDRQGENRVHLKHNGIKIVASLHLQHAPQAVMLVCRLEILTLHSSSEEPAHLIMQPQRGQYNDVLANDTYLVAVVKDLATCYFGWWISGLDLHKANFVLF